MWKKLILFHHLLKIQNGAYHQCNQLTSYIVDTYLVYDVAISSRIFFVTWIFYMCIWIRVLKFREGLF